MRFKRILPALVVVGAALAAAALNGGFPWGP
jgi:peptidoglycan/LPS O-acetylase OafA/YrhL